MHTIVLLVYHFQCVQPIYTLSKSPYMYKRCQSTQVVSNTKWNKLIKMFTQSVQILKSSQLTSTMFQSSWSNSLRETRAHPVDFLVPMLVLWLTTILFYSTTKKSIICVMYLTGFCLTFQAFVQLLWSYTRITVHTEFRDSAVYPVGRTCDLCYQSMFIQFIMMSTVWCL